MYFDYGKYYWRLDIRPPVLEVGWEFEQKQPLLYRGVSPYIVAGAGPAYTLTATSVTQMKAYRMRAKAKGRANAYVKAMFNIDKLFYNDLIFDLDEFVAYVFADIYIVYADQSKQTAGTSTTPYWKIPIDVYNTLNICWSYGYSYTDLTMSIESLFKYPNCYKMVIDSLTDWSQWTSIITKFGTKQFLFGLLDSCTMSSDAVQLPFWEYSAISADVVDKIWARNDILSAPSSSTATIAKPDSEPYNFFYNMPKTEIAAALTAWGLTPVGFAPHSCLFYNP